MALKFSESFDWLTDKAYLIRKWTTYTPSGATDNSTFDAGRTGNCFHSIRGNVGGGMAILAKGLGANYGTMIIGVAFKQSALFGPPGFGEHTGMEIYDAGTVQMGWYIDDATGSLKVYRGSHGGTLLYTTPGNTVQSNVYSYVEMKVVFGNSPNGAVYLKCNGNLLVSATGIDTTQSANAYGNGIRLIGYTVRNGTQPSFDDLYVCDNSGSVNNDFLGQPYIYALSPTGAGATTQWTPNAGSNWDRVDDTNPDDDTTYNSSDTIGNKDTYAFEDMPAGNWAVKAIMHNIMATSGDRTIRALTRVGSTDYESATLTPEASYGTLFPINETNPATGNPWTTAELNSAEFGVKVQT